MKRVLGFCTTTSWVVHFCDPHRQRRSSGGALLRASRCPQQVRSVYGSYVSSYSEDRWPCWALDAFQRGRPGADRARTQRRNLPVGV